MTKVLIWFEGFSGTKGWDGAMPWNFSAPWGPNYEREAIDFPWDGIAANKGRYYGPAHQGLRPQSWGQAAWLTPVVTNAYKLWHQAGCWIKNTENLVSTPGMWSPFRPIAQATTVAERSPISATHHGMISWRSSTSTYWLMHNYSGTSPTGDVWINEVPGNCPNVNDGNWHWFEERMKAASTNTGVYEMRIDGVVIGRGENIRTCNVVANGGYNGYFFVENDHYSNWRKCYSDDVYVMYADSEGELDWIGKSGVEGMIATGDGDLNEGTPSVGSSHSAVVKLPRNDDTYITLTAGSKTELFTPSAIDQRTPRTVYGVKVAFVAKKNGPGVRMIRPIVKVNGTTYNGTTFYVSAGWRERAYIWELNPDTGLAWTADEVDAAQFGFEQVP